jgi:hypothetical protein
MKNFFIKNWKTTLGGIVVIILTGLHAQGKIGQDLFTTLIGLLTAAGLIAAKDADKTGSI